jgi:hypothetical protein
MINLNLPNRTPIFHAIRLRAIENCRLVMAARRRTAALFDKTEWSGSPPKAAAVLKLFSASHP